MSFANLKQAILTEAKAQAQDIEGQLKSRFSSEQQRILAQAKEIEEAIIDDAGKEGDRLARRKRQETELACRAAVLRAKEEELSAIEQTIVEELTSASDAALYSNLVKSLPKQEGEIVAGELHADLVKKAAKGFDVAKETIPGEAGFVFRGKNTEINLTLRHLVRMMFKKHRTRIASLLFS